MTWASLQGDRGFLAPMEKWEKGSSSQKELFLSVLVMIIKMKTV